MFLVLIETSGNQNYIFSTNKLKENIGASELTYRAGTSWVVEAVEQVRGASESIHEVGRWVEEAIAIDSSISANELRKKLLDIEGWNKPIEAEDSKVEIIVATSGKALLLTKDKDIAKSIIRYVTHKATRFAPGLDICGVIHEFEWGTGLGKAVRDVHKEHEKHRFQKPSVDLRFLRLPVIDECTTSGLPASYLDTKTNDEKSVTRSAVSKNKRRYGEIGRKRIENLLKQYDKNFNFVRSIRALNEEDFEENLQQEASSNKLDWLAVIHADGNGLGEIFLNFHKYIKSQDDRVYTNALREFSIALDICTEKAFIEALTAFPKNSKGLIPIVPLILGGDDLSVVCDGRSALEFTQRFLSNFEIETQNLQSVENRKITIIKEAANSAFGVQRLSACAGVTIIKPHFRFSIAYELSEKLMKSAKKVKEIVKDKPGDKGKAYPCSALDFHVLYDSSNVDLDLIRAKLREDSGKTKLYSRPYVITPITNLQEATGLDWVKVHQWELLQTRVKVLKAKDENDNNRRKLPNSQIHSLREALFLGREVAEARYSLIRERYLKEGIDKLEFEENPSYLFCQEDNSETYITGLLDAIEAAEFIKLNEEQVDDKA
ncbi:hypothetical protein [Floridanema aerugineum]|uniref:Uncharacterized protein n=1 Tax=Floridaenema aerugineum BLCC-F46 TaxID=3153654 RepID=A0ABV4XJL7_9CYAN